MAHGTEVALAMTFQKTGEGLMDYDRCKTV